MFGKVPTCEFDLCSQLNPLLVYRCPGKRCRVPGTLILVALLHQARDTDRITILLQGSPTTDTGK